MCARRVGTHEISCAIIARVSHRLVLESVNEEGAAEGQQALNSVVLPNHIFFWATIRTGASSKHNKYVHSRVSFASLCSICG
jgi:hypothetical protein